MVGRTYHVSSSIYRYGFNGKENDNEAKGEGNEQDYGMRVYDGRVGRFLSADPIAMQYPMLTPYQFGSNDPISGVDRDGLEYSPAGKVGIFAIDQTSVQLYYNNPKVIIQQQEDAPARHLMREMARINSRPPPTISPQWQPTAFEKWRHEINKRTWYDNDGYNEDGTPKPGTRLVNNKTWNSFANNLALPTLEALSYTGGGGEAKALLKGTIAFLERKEFQALATEGVINAKMIRFSQDNIKSEFKGGGDLNKLIDLLKTGNKVNIPPIRIVEKDGMVFTLDNRRLYVFQQAGVKVPYVKLDKIPPEELARKFSTENNGISIIVRGKKK